MYPIIIAGVHENEVFLIRSHSGALSKIYIELFNPLTLKVVQKYFP